MLSKDNLGGMFKAWYEEHRTNQQSAVRVFIEFLVQWHEKNRNLPIDNATDLRNKATWELAAKLNQERPCLPYI